MGVPRDVSNPSPVMPPFGHSINSFNVPKTVERSEIYIDDAKFARTAETDPAAEVTDHIEVTEETGEEAHPKKSGRAKRRHERRVMRRHRREHADRTATAKETVDKPPTTTAATTTSAAEETTDETVPEETPAAPTATATDACTNDHSFIETGSGEGCKWIGKSPDDRCQLSGATEACPAACNPECAEIKNQKKRHAKRRERSKNRDGGDESGVTTKKPKSSKSSKSASESDDR